MTDEPFSISALRSNTPRTSKCEKLTAIELNQNSNTEASRTDSTLTLTNLDEKTETEQLLQKNKSASQKDGCALLIRKGAKKSFHVRSTKASRARAESCRKKEQSSRNSQNQINNNLPVPALKIPVRVMSSDASLQRTAERSSTTLKSDSGNNINTQRTSVLLNQDLIESSQQKQMPTDKSTIDGSFYGDRLGLETPEIDFNNRVKAKFKTLSAKLGNESTGVIQNTNQEQGDCDKLICKFRGDLNLKSKIAEAHTKQQEKCERKTRDSFAKIECMPPLIRRGGGNDMRKTSPKAIINTTLGTDSKIFSTFPTVPSNCESEEMNLQELNESQIISDIVTKVESSNNDVKLRRPALSDRTGVRTQKSKPSSQQNNFHSGRNPPTQALSENVNTKQRVSNVENLAHSMEKKQETSTPAKPMDADVFDNIPKIFLIDSVEKLREMLLAANVINKQLEKQLADATEELTNTKTRLQIAESAVEHLKTEQQTVLTNLSKRVSEVDELMSTAVAEREIWKAKAIALEKELKNKARVEVKTPVVKPHEKKHMSKHFLNNSATEITTHCEQHIHTANERKGERKHKTVIKILKTVKKVQMTPELYEKLSIHSTPISYESNDKPIA